MRTHRDAERPSRDDAHHAATLRHDERVERPFSPVGDGREIGVGAGSAQSLPDRVGRFRCAERPFELVGGHDDVHEAAG